MEGIVCEDLHKAYGKVQALGGVSFTAREGEVLALLGSNGSGKTTMVRILTTLLNPDSGSARVAGKDIRRDAAGVRAAIGFTGQETVIDKFLTGEEYIGLVAQLHHVPRRLRAQETKALVAEFALEDVAQARVGTYSGGTRRRLDLASSFAGAPSVLFLDEPAVGLDPHGRKRLWEAIRRRAAEGTTVLLTTQHMEEADALAGSVVVLARGQVIASGTPSQLKDQINRRTVELTMADPDHAEKAKAILATQGVQAAAGEAPDTLGFILLKSDPSLLAILKHLDAMSVEVSDIAVRRPTLDEAFLHLTTGAVEDVYKPEPAEVA
ncbi:MAG TPA: ATP-binding cassette domain-containing protein [Solirubrobacteraceae bacterium]